MSTKPTIIPIAAGKGGVGKTFLVANLAIALAEMGHHIIAVDMDLGGANLHSFLGLSNQNPGIGDFLKARSAGLHELIVKTDTPGLEFLPGDGRTPFLANIPHAQKIRLVTHLKQLTADYILVDLGAGTTFNTLDFFRLSKSGILVITPEYPSIMSMLSFLKHFIFRTIERVFRKDQEIIELLRSTYKQPMTSDQGSIVTLQANIRAINESAGEKVEAICRHFRPRIVFNMGDDPDEIMIAGHINKSLESILTMSADYFGFIFNDSKVRESVKRRSVFLPSYRESIAARDILRIAERILKYWSKSIQNSAELLMNNTRKLHEGRN